MGDSPHAARARIVTWAGLIGSPVMALVVYLLLSPVDWSSSGGQGVLSGAAAVTAAIAVLMVGWWLSEAVPLSVTALIPVVAFPLLGVTSFQAAASPYASDIIFLFGGGFVLGAALERWGLHRRIALVTLLLIGTSPRAMVAGILLASAGISMWVSNTATAIMMLPIGLSLVALVRARLGPEHEPHIVRFASCIVLAVAYGASIGGVGTLIGTPPNLVFSSFVRERYGQSIGFIDWMRIAVPLIVVFLPLTWAYLVGVAFRFTLPTLPGERALIRKELRLLGPMSAPEWIVLIVFLLALVSWVFRPAIISATGVSGLSDAAIALIAALLLFLLPARLKGPVFVMDWAHAEKLPWGVLVLFGGGLSLAAAISATGLDSTLGGGFHHLSGVPPLIIVTVVVLGVVFLSELASNTAVATSLMPVLAGAAAGLGVHPYLLLIPATFAASFAFMLPVGTPPNAIAFSSGMVSARQMARTGLWLNLMGVAIISLLVYFLGSTLLGIDLR